jgi:hypothetical protein
MRAAPAPRGAGGRSRSAVLKSFPHKGKRGAIPARHYGRPSAKCRVPVQSLDPGFIADLAADHAAGSSRGKAGRRAVASFRNGEYRGRFRRHLSRRVRAAPADASTCRASFPEPASPFEAEGAPVRPPDRDRCLHLSCGPGVHEIAQRVSVTAGSRGAPAAWVPPPKNADGPLPHPHASADPPLRLHRAPCRHDGPGAHPGRNMICRPCNEIDEDPDPGTWALEADPQPIRARSHSATSATTRWRSFSFSDSC